MLPFGVESLHSMELKVQLSLRCLSHCNPALSVSLVIGLARSLSKLCNDSIHMLEDEIVFG